ncbi:rootletin-like isoform X2 [Melopsittacus undulatus]|uniref:rootletin-like isoform X2 n=1 Tax=Melopsittacus undulatus TaxID=13146 RepID=UPI001469B4F8|nr:rootletin-like isoform X2 [Melopsittacus undulatus]
MGSAVSAIEKATIEGLLCVAKKTGYSIPRQELVDLLVWCRKRGLLENTAQLFSKDQWRKIGEELWESVQTEHKGAKKLTCTYRSIKLMIDQMHAEAEIAAALKGALSESTKNSDLGETDLIEWGPIPDPVPPRTSPEKTKIAAPVHKKGEFDDLIIPWDPSDELPTQPSAPPEPEPMEVLPENVPLPSENDDELQKESPYAELVKELRQQRHQMARLMIAVKNLDKDGDTGKKREMYKKAMEAIKEGIKNIERQLDQKEKLDAGGREGIKRAIRQGELTIKEGHEKIKRLYGAGEGLTEKEKRDLQDDLDEGMLEDERAKGYIPKRVNEYIPTDHSFDMGRRWKGVITQANLNGEVTLEPLISAPVRVTQNGAEWTPLDWNLVSKLQQSVMAYGATNSAVRRQMTAFMKYQELVPANIRLLMETLLGATAFIMFLVKWQERLEVKQLEFKAEDSNLLEIKAGDANLLKIKTGDSNLLEFKAENADLLQTATETEVNEVLRSTSPEKNEALEAQQQMSLFQNRIREQNAHLEMLREKAHDLEVQLESSQKNAKDKENTFAQMEENMEDTIQQLCESTEEKEQDVKSLQDLVASERLSVLQCALSVRDSEIRELKNEIALCKMKEQQHVEELTISHEKDICRQLENLRAELEKCHRREIAEARQVYEEEMVLKYKNELEELKRELCALNSEEHVQTLNGIIIDLNKSLHESEVNKESLRKRLENQQEDFEREKSEIETKYKGLIDGLKLQLSDAEEQLKEAEQYKQVKQSSRGKIQKLNSLVKELNEKQLYEAKATTDVRQKPDEDNVSNKKVMTLRENQILPEMRAEFDAMWNEPHQLTGEDELVHEELEFQYGFGVGSSRDPLAEIKNSEVTENNENGEGDDSLKVIETKIEQQQVYRYDPEYPVMVLVYGSQQYRSAIIAQQIEKHLAILEWVFPSYQPSASVTTLQDYIGSLLLKAKERVRLVFGVDPSVFVLPWKTTDLIQEWSLCSMTFALAVNGVQLSTHYPSHPLFQTTSIIMRGPIVKQKPISNALTVFTDASGRTGKYGFAWQDNQNWKLKIWTDTGKSVQILELQAIVETLNWFSSQALNIVSDSAYAVSVVNRIDCAKIGKIGTLEIEELVIRLKGIIQERKEPIWCCHMRSHTNLPGIFSQGNAVRNERTADGVLINYLWNLARELLEEKRNEDIRSGSTCGSDGTGKYDVT